MYVFARAGSKAESVARRVAAREAVPRRALPPEAEVIAPGFKPQKKLNLHDQGGKIIPDLVYTNFFVGGAGAWDSQDIQNIDQNLSKAMSDPHLNNVMAQYFRGSQVTTTFRANAQVGGHETGPRSQMVDMGEVDEYLELFVDDAVWVQPGDPTGDGNLMSDADEPTSAPASRRGGRPESLSARICLIALLKS